MEVNLTPDIEAQLDRLAADSGRAKEEFVLDAMAGYFDELAELHETLDSRYEDLKSGKVKPIAGDIVESELRQRIAERRSRRS